VQDQSQFLNDDSGAVEQMHQSQDQDTTDVGIQYIQFIYQDNVKLQQEISGCTEEILRLDTEHIKQRDKWEDEIAEIQR